MSELKACPFCGCETSGRVRFIGDVDTFVECIVCHAQGPLVMEGDNHADNVAGARKEWNTRTPDTSAKVDVRLLNDAITLITKSLASMLTDASFASPYVEDHRPRVPTWVMTHFQHDHDRRVEYVNDINQRLNWIRNATEKVRNEALQAPRSDTSAVEKRYPLTPEGKPIFGEGSDWCAKSYFEGVADDSAVELVEEGLRIVSTPALNYADRHQFITKAEQWLKNRGE